VIVFCIIFVCARAKEMDTTFKRHCITSFVNDYIGKNEKPWNSLSEDTCILMGLISKRLRISLSKIYTEFPYSRITYNSLKSVYEKENLGPIQRPIGEIFDYLHSVDQDLMKCVESRFKRKRDDVDDDDGTDLDIPDTLTRLKHKFDLICRARAALEKELEQERNLRLKAEEQLRNLLFTPEN
jgi:hypothetical protein